MMRHRASLCALVVGLVVLVGCTQSDEVGLRAPVTSTSAPIVSSTGPVVGTAGAMGVGDPYFPGLGNGGYDVGRYDLAIRWFADEGTIDATARIDLTASQDLASLNLDLVGLEVSGITVGGVAASFARDGRELVVQLPRGLRKGEETRLIVDYGGAPEPIVLGTELFRVGWQTDGRDAFVVSEPAGAATWFPANDHPTDKASFRFEITVPDDLSVAANGTLRETRPAFPGTTWVYEAPDAMATYLASVVIGDLAFDASSSPSGVPIRNAYPERLADAARADYASTGRILQTFEDWFGPYPFSVYGQVVVDETLGFALENQTLSLFGSDLITGNRAVDRFVAHELAHQWFGNAVSPSTWRDVWLNEGFATYAEWIWAQESGGPTIAATAERVHAGADFGVAPGDPGPAELFQPTVYLRGALALHALSVEIGDAAFRGVLRDWTRVHDDGSASTADFEALSEQAAGRELDQFFEAWIYGASLPPLP